MYWNDNKITFLFAKCGTRKLSHGWGWRIHQKSSPESEFLFIYMSRGLFETEEECRKSVEAFDTHAGKQAVIKRFVFEQKPAFS